MRKQTYTHDQLLTVARSLGPVPGSEYHRAVCELIGRLMLDVAGAGEGTGENAALVAAQLQQCEGTNVRITISATYDRALDYELNGLFTGLSTAAREGWLDDYGSDVTNHYGRRVGTITITKTQVGASK